MKVVVETFAIAEDFIKCRCFLTQFYQLPFSSDILIPLQQISEPKLNPVGLQGDISMTGELLESALSRPRIIRRTFKPISLKESQSETNKNDFLQSIELFTQS